MQNFTEFLSWVAAVDKREAEWIDLLSMLEYVGCRKVLKAVSYDQVSFDVLQHVYEEASHAYFLKELVVKHGLSNRPYSENHFADIGWKYFKGLDEAVAKLLQEEPAKADPRAYPVVSWAIETRALIVYREYIRMTKDEAVRKTLATILAQEKRHEVQFEKNSLSVSSKDKVFVIEALLWNQFQTDVFSRCERLEGR